MDFGAAINFLPRQWIDFSLLPPPPLITGGVLEAAGIEFISADENKGSGGEA